MKQFLTLFLAVGALSAQTSSAMGTDGFGAFEPTLPPVSHALIECEVRTFGNEGTHSKSFEINTRDNQMLSVDFENVRARVFSFYSSGTGKRNFGMNLYRLEEDTTFYPYTSVSSPDLPPELTTFLVLSEPYQVVASLHCTTQPS